MQTTAGHPACFPQSMLTPPLPISGYSRQVSRLIVSDSDVLLREVLCSVVAAEAARQLVTADWYIAGKGGGAPLRYIYAKDSAYCPKRLRDKESCRCVENHALQIGLLIIGRRPEKS